MIFDFYSGFVNNDCLCIWQLQHFNNCLLDGQDNWIECICTHPYYITAQYNPFELWKQTKLRQQNCHWKLQNKLYWTNALHHGYRLAVNTNESIWIWQKLMFPNHFLIPFVSSYLQPICIMEYCNTNWFLDFLRINCLQYVKKNKNCS